MTFKERKEAQKCLLSLNLILLILMRKGGGGIFFAVRARIVNDVKN